MSNWLARLGPGLRQILSFTGPNGELWLPERSGDYVTDCRTGRFYAEELIGFMSIHGHACLYVHVCKAIATEFGGGELGGVEIGFLTRMAEAAASTLEVAHV